MPNPSKLDALLRGIAGQAPESKYIRAYHGSPYDWDKVDMSMVSKGEGPLLEGYGLYATLSEPNANWYRNNNTVIRRRGLANVVRSARYLARKGDAEGAANMMDAANAVIPRLQKSFPRGRTYELEFPFSEDQLLKWDAPLQEQPRSVQDAAESLLGPSLYDWMRNSEWRNNGAELYWTLAGRQAGTNMPTPEQMQVASRKLYEAGVPGHTYSDEWDGGAVNFVAYPGTEDSIRILRKYGVMAPVPMAAGAAGATMEE